MSAEKQIKFLSLSSGSCGNCYYLCAQDELGQRRGILIDAGVSPRRLKKEFIARGLRTDEIAAILVTHDHFDHIRSLGSYCKHLGIPVWSTEVLNNVLGHQTYALDCIHADRRILAAGTWNEIIPGLLSARYFIVPHDATQTVGYSIDIDGYRFVIMTDIGAMTQEALQMASEAQTVVIESNYDTDMLISGPYTHELKMRICQGNGHLSNDECADAIREFYHDGLRHIFLCHLSENNNTATLAHACSSEALEHAGAAGSTSLVALPRQTASTIFTLQR